MKNLSLLMGLLVVISACNVSDDNGGGNKPYQSPFAGRYDFLDITGPVLDPVLDPVNVPATLDVAIPSNGDFSVGGLDDFNTYKYVSGDVDGAVYKVTFSRNKVTHETPQWIKLSLTENTLATSGYEESADKAAGLTTGDKMAEKQGFLLFKEFYGTWSEVVLAATDSKDPVVPVLTTAATVVQPDDGIVDGSEAIIIAQTGAVDSDENEYSYEKEASAQLKDHTAIFKVLYSRTDATDVTAYVKAMLSSEKDEVLISPSYPDADAAAASDVIDVVTKIVTFAP